MTIFKRAIVTKLVKKIPWNLLEMMSVLQTEIQLAYSSMQLGDSITESICSLSFIFISITFDRHNKSVLPFFP